MVIAILGLLIGILLPSLSRAQEAAEEIRESNAARQMALAWRGYSVDQGERLMVGYYSVKGGSEDATLESYPIRDSHSAPVIDVRARQRYPWRLYPYLEKQLGGTILTGEQRSLAGSDPGSPGSSERFAWQYEVSVYPSWGINAHFLGGYGVPPDEVKYAKEYQQNLPFRVTRRMDQIHSPSRMIVFGSSRGEGYEGFTSVTIPGWHVIQAPQWTDLGPLGGGVPGAWSASTYRASSHPNLYGNVDPRFGGGEKVLVCFADGHAAKLTVDELRDMRLWSDDAARVDDPEWTPGQSSR